MVTLRNLMNENVVSVPPETSVTEAAGRMVVHDLAW